MCTQYFLVGWHQNLFNQGLSIEYIVFFNCLETMVQWNLMKHSTSPILSNFASGNFLIKCLILCICED